MWRQYCPYQSQHQGQRNKEGCALLLSAASYLPPAASVAYFVSTKLRILTNYNQGYGTVYERKKRGRCVTDILASDRCN